MPDQDDPDVIEHAPRYSVLPRIAIPRIAIGKRRAMLRHQPNSLYSWAD
jgi:hypothetical protein